ncbi:MAG TPA: glycerophosphodiester phosphodiesterase family protein [Gammaproteobacteria bacterium]|jgi:glycerophosphoryl diester phosphodiesterase|nr:glycerophosphodiester phosphodiesterase family protein [Gammaproteobacteria bacterium]
MALLNFIPPIIAHRGASSQAPENTLAAFIKAAQLGVRWIEFDVLLAACQTPIIFHDADLDRTTNGHGLVYEYPYTVLQTLDAGSWFHPHFTGERILTLQQALAFFQNSGLNANIELKALPGTEEQLVRQVAKVVTPYLLEARFTILFSSFSVVALEWMRRIVPDSLLALNVEDWHADRLAESKALHCVSLHLADELVTPAVVQTIKESGKMVLAYTVNEEAMAQQFFSWGVDAVFSDIPLNLDFTPPPFTGRRRPALVAGVPEGRERGVRWRRDFNR